MSYLRLVRPLDSPAPSPAQACVQAFDRELEYVFGTLRRLGARQAEVEDLAQDVFVVLYRNWSTLDTERSLRPYLFGVAFRIVCAQSRRRKRESPLPVQDIADATAVGPERTLESRQAVALLLAALERVPLARRAVLILHELEQVPVGDIAQTLGITRFGVHARLRKGRKELLAAVRRLRQQRRFE